MRQSLFTEILPLQQIHVEQRNAIQDEQREFVTCIRSGQRPRVCGVQARYCLDVAEQIQASIAAKQIRARRRLERAAALVLPQRPPLPQQTPHRKAG